MTKTEQRRRKNWTRNLVRIFLRIRVIYFSILVEDIKKVMNATLKKHPTYQIEVALYAMLIKNIYSLESIQSQNKFFNEDTALKNIFQVLEVSIAEYLPIYAAVEEHLNKLENDELEKIHKKMIYGIVKKRRETHRKFLDKKRLVLMDTSEVFCFKERHCEQCLSRTVNEGTPEERTIYYHHLLEARVYLADNLILGLGTELIEASTPDHNRIDCELAAFTRLAKRVQKAYPRLSICLFADKQYACNNVFKLCRRNSWNYLIHYNQELIPELMTDFQKAVQEQEATDCYLETEEIYHVSCRKKQQLKIRWVNDLVYKKYPLHVLNIKVERLKKLNQEYTLLSDIPITSENVEEFIDTGRKIWLIDNELYPVRRNHKYLLTHDIHVDENAMKNQNLMVQIADVLKQLYEKGENGVTELRFIITHIAEAIWESMEEERRGDGEENGDENEL